LSTAVVRPPCSAYALINSTIKGNQLCRRRKFSIRYDSLLLSYS